MYREQYLFVYIENELAQQKRIKEDHYSVHEFRLRSLVLVNLLASLFSSGPNSDEGLRLDQVDASTSVGCGVVSASSTSISSLPSSARVPFSVGPLVSPVLSRPVSPPSSFMSASSF